MVVPHVVDRLGLRRPLLLLVDQRRGREAPVSHGRKPSQPDQVLCLFGVLDVRHHDAPRAGIQRIIDQLGRAAWDPDKWNHGAVGVVLNRANKAD